MRTKLLILFVVLAALAAISYSTDATPGFSLWTGNRCSECHATYQGGGMRNGFGWQFGKDASLFQPQDVGLKSVYDALDAGGYYFFDSLLSVGADFRYQTVRSHKTEAAERRYFPMQASLYLASDPAEWIHFGGQYNAGPKIFNGQQMWSAYTIIKPAENLPMIRAGYFQPSMGIRDCDMTMLDRRIPASDGSEVMIAPDFAEYGVELAYEGFDWLTANLGVFDSKSLSELSIFGGQIPLILKGNPSFNARLVFYPAWFFDIAPDSYIGSSFFINGEFIYSSAFAGLAINEDFSLNFQYNGYNSPYTRNSVSYIGGINYNLLGIMFGLRGEIGETRYFLNSNVVSLETKQASLYARIFLLPHIQFIPEYRFQETEEFRSTRWIAQFHFYY